MLFLQYQAGAPGTSLKAHQKTLHKKAENRLWKNPSIPDLADDFLNAHEHAQD
ncbi:MAG TPA: hypothetical protein VEC96_07355 [Anaerolineae bacterium]|nr:hypothetical protein [Anaerolineae bacterium]